MDKTYKHFTASIEPVSERKMSFLITTASVDRDGDTIDPKGWDLSSYTKNPVVLWAHDYSQPPIGKAVNIQATQDGLKADVEFVPQGMSPFADMIHDMCKGGFLNATSVGFRGVDHEKAKDRDRGYDFKKQELLEFSIVPVPSNPEALAQRGVKNTQLQKYAKAMRHWTKEVLGDDAPKLDAEKFDNLADAIAKAMKDEPKKEEAGAITREDVQAMIGEALKSHKVVIELDGKEIAKHVGLQPGTGISTDVLDIKTVEPEIVWDKIDLPEPGIEIDAEQVAKLFLDGMRETLKEMAGAQARAAINRMTGRLD
jgi:HK97 family phage prohead protease